MYLCAKCCLTVSYVYTVHSNKVGVKGEEKQKRKEFLFWTLSSLFNKKVIFLLLDVTAIICIISILL